MPLLDEAAIAALLRHAPAHRGGGRVRPAGPALAGRVRWTSAPGDRCVPVTPRWAAVAGVVAYPDLAAAVAATGPFDIVDVFRRSEDCPATPRRRLRPVLASCGSSWGS